MLQPNRNFRFAIWIIAVAMILTCRVIKFAGSIAIIITCLLLIFGLLCDTPSNAIRLPRWISEAFILASTAARAWYPAMPVGIHLFILFVLLIILRLSGKSPWWAVLYAWFPAY